MMMTTPSTGIHVYDIYSFYSHLTLCYCLAQIQSDCKRHCLQSHTDHEDCEKVMSISTNHEDHEKVTSILLVSSHLGLPPPPRLPPPLLLLPPHHPPSL